MLVHIKLFQTMKLTQYCIFILFFSSWGFSYAQTSVIKIKKGESWYGGLVNEAHKMPFKDGYSFNLFANTGTNQASPLLLSTNGRYIWSDAPFEFTVKGDQLLLLNATAPILIDSMGRTLKEAYIKASKDHFPSKGILPDTLLFFRPQYNTWIELVYNQNQTDIIKYAHDIIANGFPTGVLMIDDNW
ncbi:Maltodextrin glucosidase [Arcticibacter svalbardensis MN12-7]|uniref:Maltodextrin glucosidase n=2 Tax=Arcticibacter TaxID=1288026 RepID=R9GS49_9SPHI|nr:Maltodextrin glucosidase [Arcticibacter svalbardensis MN12-7]